MPLVESAIATLRDRFVVEANFFSGAEQMRKVLEAHFSEPHRHTPEIHQVWNYWYVPQLYTYLRTNPDLVLGAELVSAFMDRLRIWAIHRLGTTEVTRPYLSLYVNGCSQGLHNDAGNGRWGYVFSLTRWEQRKFMGGETLLVKESNYWESDQIRLPNAGLGLYDLVPPHFNQLLVFDDRVPHAVPAVQGPMDPLEGRVVLHGHLREGAVVLRGGLKKEQVAEALGAPSKAFAETMRGLGGRYHGIFSLRLVIAPDGTLTAIDLLADRVLKMSPAGPPADTISRELVRLITGTRFPATSQETVTIIPVSVGADLPQ
jgi:hypothetical protein